MSFSVDIPSNYVVDNDLGAKLFESLGIELKFFDSKILFWSFVFNKIPRARFEYKP